MRHFNVPQFIAILSHEMSIVIINNVIDRIKNLYHATLRN